MAANVFDTSVVLPRQKIPGQKIHRRRRPLTTPRSLCHSPVNDRSYVDRSGKRRQCHGHRRRPSFRRGAPRPPWSLAAVVKGERHGLILRRDPPTLSLAVGGPAAANSAGGSPPSARSTSLA